MRTQYIDAVFSCSLESEFLGHAQGPAVRLSILIFERGYEQTLKAATHKVSPTSSTPPEVLPVTLVRAHFHRSASHNARFYTA